MLPVELPAHPALRPKPLNYQPAAGTVADALRQSLGGVTISRATTAHAAPFGYYRVEAAQPLFVKVAPRERLAHMLAVQTLVVRLAAEACPVQPMQGEPLQLPGGAVGFVHEYLTERFADDSVADAFQVGAALRAIHLALAGASGAATAVRLSSQWHRAMAEFPARDRFAADVAEAVLSEWNITGEVLDRDRQLIHNDYHRGNVLMGADGVAAVLDFDDAIVSVGSPLVDLATGLERFCLADVPDELSIALAAAFMEGYGRSPAQTSAKELRLLAVARLLFSLSILDSSPRPDSQAWQTERRKFVTLIENWRQWQQRLISAGFRP